MWTYICSVGSHFVLLDIVERSLEPYTPGRVLVILEEELERAGGDPDFRMFHREGGFWTIAETFREDLYSERESERSYGQTEKVIESGTNYSAIVKKCFVWGGPNYLVAIIDESIHDCNGRSLTVKGVKEAKEARKRSANARWTRMQMVEGKGKEESIHRSEELQI